MNGFGDSQPPERPSRRIADEEEDEEEEVGSNPDEIIDERISDPEDEGEGEDLNENWLNDYTAVPELDTYDANDLASDAEDDVMTYQQRREVNELLDKRDGDRRARREDRMNELTGVGEGRGAPAVGQFRSYGTIADDREDEDEQEQNKYVETDVNLEAFDVPLREWIAQERTRREIKKRFRNFLRKYRVNGTGSYVHQTKIKDMCLANRVSMHVSYVHLSENDAILAIWLADVPGDMIQIFDEVLKEEVLVMFPHYQKISQDVHVRITDLPICDKLRDLRQGHLNSLVRVTGVITRRTGVFPQLRAVAYDCACGMTLGPFKIEGGIEIRPSICSSCNAAGPFKLNSQKTQYGNYQKVTLQESPGSVPPGRVPRYKDVILLGDLIDIARPGDEIEVTGIYMHTSHSLSKDRSGFPVFSTIIEANCVQKKGGDSNAGLSDEDKRSIRKLSQDPQILERILRSVAPSIYGHRHVKTALALSLFGGCAQECGSLGTHRVRGDINVLLLGDPGTAKSQLLKYAEKIAPRAVYTTGKGASAVGLTAGVHRDPMTKEWTLEGGALVLADQGMCLIDEFDKMNEQDRTSIHEAMEQQTISVSKAGIVTSLQARCAVLAAANPIGGRYDQSYTLAENVELTDPILQRFDILCVLQDMVDPIIDEQLATFVVGSHMRSHPDHGPELDAVGVGQDGLPMTADNDSASVNDDFDGDENNVDSNGSETAGKKRKLAALDPSQDDGPQPIDQALLKKYIIFARTKVKPALRQLDTEKVASLYADLRAQSLVSGGVPIAVRHIESVVRMSEAFAKMHLRDHVRDDDVDNAIKVMLESFIQAQKVSVRRSLQKCFRKYITFGEEKNNLLMHELQQMIRTKENIQQLRYQKASESVVVYIDELDSRAKTLNVYDLRPFFRSALFRNHGMHLDESKGVIIKSF